MIAHKPVKPINEVVENAKTMQLRSKNRSVVLSRLDDESYFLYLRCVYSGPTIVRTKRRISQESMAGIIQMYMTLNGISHMKIEDGRLMWRTDPVTT